MTGTTRQYDSMRASRDFRPETKRSWLFTFRALLAAVVFLIGCVCISFFRNARDVWTAQDLLRSLNGDINGQKHSEAFKDLDRLWTEMENHRSPPDLLKRFGLYQGYAIARQLEHSYFEAAARLLLNPVLAGLEQRFLSNPAALRQISPGDSLKLYQMIHRQEHCSLDKPFFVKWAGYVQGNLDSSGLNESTRAIASKHLAVLANPAMLSQVPDKLLRPWSQDVVLLARDQVGKTGDFKEVYSEIILQANREPVTLADVLTDEPDRIKQLLDQHESSMLGKSEVEGAYSIRQFSPVRSAILNWRSHLGIDACVFGSSRETPAPNHPQDTSTDHSAALYAATYKDRWKDFLGSAKLKPFGIPEAAKRLELLAGDRSPLAAVLALASRHTSLPTESDKAPKNESGEDELRAISKVFDPVHRVIPPGSDRWTGGWWNDSYRRLLLDLKDSMASVAEQPSSREARKKVRDTSSASLNAIELLQFPSGTEGIDRIVKDLLRSPFEIARSQVPEDASKEINQMLSGVCRDLDPLRGKFPFKPTASQNLTEQELRRVFDPATGAFLRFASGGFVQRAGPGEAWLSGPQVIDFVLDEKFLDFLNRLGQISRAFFSKGQSFGFQFSVRLSATPVDMPTELRIGGLPGKKVAADGTWQFDWPGPEPASGFSLRTPSQSVDYEGMWGLYRMIRNNKQDPAMNRIELSRRELAGGGVEEFRHNGSPARVDLTFQNLPNGINGFFVLPDCPHGAAKR